MSSRSITIGLAAVLVLTVFGTAFAWDTYDYKDLWCPVAGGHGFFDKWGFYKCDESSYVADKINEHGVTLNIGYYGGNWGEDWIRAAETAGVHYDTTPKQYGGLDVAYLPGGHIAYVENVTFSGDVVVSSYVSYNYSKWTIEKGSASYPQFFIHFDKGR